jgi:hypothetical protein
MIRRRVGQLEAELAELRQRQEAWIAGIKVVFAAAAEPLPPELQERRHLQVVRDAGPAR